MTDKNLQLFCHDHGIRILDTNKRAHVTHRVNVNLFTDPSDFNVADRNMHVVCDTEPLYTVEIAESELQKIADFESQVFNHMKTTGRYNLFEILMEQKEQEKYLKEKYPAVQRAYEQYSLMLKLAESGEL
jgi:hypothetical protein